MKLLKGFVINLQFFTIIPISVKVPMDEDHLERSVQTFPLLGLLQGSVYAAVLYGLLQWTPFTPLAVAFIITLLTIVMTGGLHLDGWIDTCDAYFSYREKEKRLEIMTDPRVGAFGVISVIILLSSRFLFLYEIILFIQPASYFLIALVPLLSKSLMGYFLMTIRTAKKNGIAYFFQKSVKKHSLFIYLVYIFFILVVSAWISISSVMYSLLLMSVVLVFAIYYSRKIVHWFGGITGDVLGASVEGVEFILWMVVWLLHYYVMV